MNARWYLGGYNTILDTSASANYYKALFMYNVERNGENSSNYCSYNTCTEEEIITYQYWDGSIGLPYISDFGFAAEDDNDNRNCSNSMNDSTYCSQTYNWMSNGTYIWTLTPDNYDNSNSIDSSWNSTFFWQQSSISIHYVSSTYNVHPSLYLKSNTQITSGTGLSTDPYIISLL